MPTRAPPRMRLGAVLPRLVRYFSLVEWVRLREVSRSVREAVDDSLDDEGSLVALLDASGASSSVAVIAAFLTGGSAVGPLSPGLAASLDRAATTLGAGGRLLELAHASLDSASGDGLLRNPALRALSVDTRSQVAQALAPLLNLAERVHVDGDAHPWERWWLGPARRELQRATATTRRHLFFDRRTAEEDADPTLEGALPTLLALLHACGRGRLQGLPLGWFAALWAARLAQPTVVEPDPPVSLGGGTGSSAGSRRAGRLVDERGAPEGSPGSDRFLWTSVDRFLGRVGSLLVLRRRLGSRWEDEGGDAERGLEAPPEVSGVEGEEVRLARGSPPALPSLPSSMRDDSAVASRSLRPASSSTTGRPRTSAFVGSWVPRESDFAVALEQWVTDALPRLRAHLTSLGVDSLPSTLVRRWARSLIVGAIPLDGDALPWVLHRLLVGGWGAVLALAVVVLAASESDLLACRTRRQLMGRLETFPRADLLALGRLRSVEFSHLWTAKQGWRRLSESLASRGSSRSGSRSGSLGSGEDLAVHRLALVAHPGVEVTRSWPVGDSRRSSESRRSESLADDDGRASKEADAEAKAETETSGGQVEDESDVTAAVVELDKTGEAIRTPDLTPLVADLARVASLPSLPSLTSLVERAAAGGSEDPLAGAWTRATVRPVLAVDTSGDVPSPWRSPPTQWTGSTPTNWTASSGASTPASLRPAPTAAAVSTAAGLPGALRTSSDSLNFWRDQERAELASLERAVAEAAEEGSVRFPAGLLQPPSVDARFPGDVQAAGERSSDARVSQRRTPSLPRRHPPPPPAPLWNAVPATVAVEQIVTTGMPDDAREPLRSVPKEIARETLVGTPANATLEAREERESLSSVAPGAESLASDGFTPLPSIPVPLPSLPPVQPSSTSSSSSSSSPSSLSSPSSPPLVTADEPVFAESSFSIAALLRATAPPSVSATADRAPAATPSPAPAPRRVAALPATHLTSFPFALPSTGRTPRLSPEGARALHRSGKPQSLPIAASASVDVAREAPQTPLASLPERESRWLASPVASAAPKRGPELLRTLQDLFGSGAGLE